MARPIETSAEDAERLRRCLSDMVSVMALPALWAGREPRQIAAALADALLGILPLAFVFVRLNAGDGGPSIDVLRVAERPQSTTRFREAGTVVNALFGASSLHWPARGRIRMADADLSVASVQLGINGEFGALVAASERLMFPEYLEQLRLDVTATHAVLGLQQARLLDEQKRVSRELDDRVAQRTSQLAAANEQLKQRERDSRLIVDNIPGLVALLGPTGQIEVVNRQLFDYFGQTLDELQHWGANDTIHPHDLPHVLEVFSQAIASGTAYETLQRFKRADGVYRWFQNRGFPVRDAHGTVIQWCVLLTDVDERMRVEEALKTSERNLKTIINTIPGVAWSARPDGLADFLNQTYLDYTGLTADEGMGWGWTTAVHPDDLNGLLAEWQRATSAEEAGESEARLRRHDGEYRWFLFRSNALRDDNGAVVKWYGTNIDIEDRKRAEDDVRRNESFLSTAQRLSLSGSFSWCLETNAVTFSEEAYRIFGFEPGSPPTLEQIDARIHPEDRHLLAERRNAATSTGEGQDYQLRLLMADGSIKYLHTTSSEMQDANGRRQYIGALQDVTQRRLADEALNRARSELAHVSRATALGTLTASIAHEINQPLSGIVTNGSTCLRMLDADPPNIDGARETARRTIRDGNRASDVIARLRGLFGRKELTLETMDLNDATREVIALSLDDLQRHRVIVQSELLDDVALVTGDRIQLQQVILNLLRNASDAMAEVDERPRHLLIRTEREDTGDVRLTVRDTGVGLGGQNMDKLFDSFYTTKSGGMGIGLSISRAIIERHQGRLWAEDHGHGATFAFAIPACPETLSSPDD